MSSPDRTARLGTVLLLVAVLAGLGVAVYSYFAPLTGVTETLGALAAIGVSAVLVVLSLLLARRPGQGVLVPVTLIGLVGNAFAGALLHEWWLCMAMGVGLIGLLVDTLAPQRGRKAVHS